MATHLVIEAADVSKRGLRDAAAHRQGVAPVYNAYARVSGDPAFAGRQGDYQALLRPLFMLSFLVDDFLAENEFYGATQRDAVLGLQQDRLRARASPARERNGIKVIGLTSAGNTAFVKSLGCYDEVVTYDSVTSMPADRAGRVSSTWPATASLRETLHRHFGDQMKYSGRIGLTHRSSSPDEPELPGAKPTWFFAPDQIRKRAKEWGPGGIDTRFGAAWSGFAPKLDQWIEGDRRPRAGGGATGLSRYPQRPRAAGSGAYPVALGIGGISSRPFCAVPNGYRLREQGKRRKDGR